MFVIQKFSNIDNDHHHYHFITTTTTIQEREESQLVCVFPGFTDQLCWSRADIEKTPFLCFCPPGQWFKHKLNNKLPSPAKSTTHFLHDCVFFPNTILLKCGYCWQLHLPPFPQQEARQPAISRRWIARKTEEHKPAATAIPRVRHKSRRSERDPHMASN